MGKIWLTSDTHFCHKKDFLWGPRGFTSSDEHDAVIIDEWNKLVDPMDEVYHLGDWFLNDDETGLARLSMLNGIVHLIAGNHDTDNRIHTIQRNINTFYYLGYSYRLRYKGYSFYLSHYPTLTANYDDKGLKHSTINLCGHSHTKDPFFDWDKGTIFHVELDTNNNKPWLLDDIIILLQEKEKEMRKQK